MKIFRITTLILIAVASGYVTFFMKPKLTEGRQAAIVAYDINAATSDNVYQQQVVNGWATKDLLEVISLQLDNEDPRNRILLFLAVCAVCVIGVSTPQSNTRES